MSDASAELYQAVIDDHRRRPRNRGPLPSAHRFAKRENPACGDFCTIQLRLDPPPVVPDSPSGAVSELAPDTRIVAAAFTGAGCALSQASASLATVALSGRTVAEARALAATVELLVRTGSLPPISASAMLPASVSSPPPPCSLLPDLAALVAVHRFPARHACALIAWDAALAALASGSQAKS